jgi:prepilin-type N-terminal cleavage/methylation domain-containing protein/prepilin-type processing-associated H-X9-DG protein
LLPDLSSLDRLPREVHMRRNRAFTLVELLVVIGIIAVLISILLPSLNRARAQAMQTQCMSNMRQIGLSLQAYVVENKGWLPPLAPNDAQYAGAAGVKPSQVECTSDFAQEVVYTNFPNFLGSLIPYMKGAPDVFRCPTIQAAEPYWPTDTYYLPDAVSDTTCMGNAAVLGRKISMIRQSSDVAYLQEQPYRWGAAIYRPTRVSKTPDGTWLYWYFHDNSSGGPSQPFQYSNNHSKGGNLVYVDGHADYRKRSDIHARDFGLTGGAGASGTENDTYLQRPDRTYFSMFRIDHPAISAAPGVGTPTQFPNVTD